MATIHNNTQHWVCSLGRAVGLLRPLCDNQAAARSGSRSCGISAATVPCISQRRLPRNSAAGGNYAACAAPQNQPAACMHHDDSVSIQLQLTSACRMIDRLIESEQSTDGCNIMSVAGGVSRSLTTHPGLYCRSISEACLK